MFCLARWELENRQHESRIPRAWMPARIDDSLTRGKKRRASSDGHELQHKRVISNVLVEPANSNQNDAGQNSYLRVQTMRNRIRKA